MTKKILKIGITGCGAIGGSLARTLARDFKGRAALSALFDINRDKAVAVAQKLRRPGLVVGDLRALIARSDLVIEASSAKASAAITLEVLKAGKDAMVMSVGGLLGGNVKKLEKICRAKGGRLYIPSGAIAGIDALKAAAVAGIRSVTLTTTKHPRSFRGVEYVQRRGIRLDAIKKPVLLFSGSAAQAVGYFPQNINVAAVLSLAGIGAERTTVRIIASPLATKNIHEIIIESLSARIVTRTENTLHPENPKTSFLAVLSAVALLTQIIDPIRIGS